ncbi:uncharacterized protein VTP21DRAFT_7023 [Calcarisporiella thermophila]|uniref:uncharacterized protein n=1 Tax=Calcarisporiella thermophila TaxID=911321 RepID=UPI003742C0E7
MCSKDDHQSRLCTVLKFSYPGPIAMYPPKKNLLIISSNLTDHLFLVYTSNCFFNFRHPDMTIFLEQYYEKKLPPALVNTAIAWAAVHLVFAHPNNFLINRVRPVMNWLLEQARESLEEVFDSQSPQTVLAFLNMDATLILMYRMEEAYSYFHHAALLALSLKMERDDPNERNKVQIEYRRRIWCMLCKRELNYVYFSGKPPVIGLDIIRKSPVATIWPSDNRAYRMFLVNYVLDILFSTKLSGFVDIDWSLSDAEIAQYLIGISALLQHDLSTNLHYNEEELAWINVEFGTMFWVNWCGVWQKFIESDAPPQRMDSPLMQQLRAKAFEEYARGAKNATTFLQSAIRLQNWCRYYLCLYAHNVCEIHKFIARTHPNFNTRRKSFQMLNQTLQQITQLFETRGEMMQMVMQDITDALGKMKHMIFTPNELEALKRIKQRSLVVKN